MPPAPNTSRSTHSGIYTTTATNTPTYGIGMELETDVPSPDSSDVPSPDSSDVPSPDRRDDTSLMGGLVGGLVAITVVICSICILLVVIVFLRHRYWRVSQKEFQLDRTINVTGNKKGM